jgi:hypothetical protein
VVGRDAIDDVIESPLDMGITVANTGEPSPFNGSRRGRPKASGNTTAASARSSIFERRT